MSQFTNTKFNKDPESHDVLDEEYDHEYDGLDGGSRSEGGSSFWIYAVIGVVVVGLIIVLIVCLSKKSKDKKYEFKGVPEKGELTAEQTKLFVKQLFDFAQEITQKRAPLKKQGEDAAKLTDLKKKSAAIIKVLDESEPLVKQGLDLVQTAQPYADRINKTEEINGVKKVQETVNNYLKIKKELFEADKTLIETTRKLCAAMTAPKDPNAITPEELKAISDLEKQAVTQEAEAEKKEKLVKDAEPEIKKLFPAKANEVKTKEFTVKRSVARAHKTCELKKVLQ